MSKAEARSTSLGAGLSVIVAGGSILAVIYALYSGDSAAGMGAFIPPILFATAKLVEALRKH